MNKKSPNFFASAKKTFAQEVSSLAKIPNQIDRNKFNEICELIINCKGNIVLMGIGKSGNIAAKISVGIFSGSKLSKSQAIPFSERTILIF